MFIRNFTVILLTVVLTFSNSAGSLAYFNDLSIYDAIEQKNSPLVEGILRQNLFVLNQADEDGYTPLHAAIVEKFDEAVTLFLGHPGLDINHSSDLMNSPLHTAAENGNFHAVTCLLERPELRVNDLTTGMLVIAPLHAAIMNQHNAIASALINDARTDINLADGSENTPFHLAGRMNNTEVMSMLVAHASYIEIPEPPVCFRREE